MGELVTITDRNYHDYCSTGQHGTGKSFGFAGRKTPFGTTFHALGADVIPTIPRDQWPARIKLLAESKKDLRSLADAAGQKCKDQNGLSYCWVYGSTSAEEVHRTIEGQPYIELSPESVGGPCTGWRNQGGYAEEAAKQLQVYGACASSFMDAPCSLHSSRWKAGWQQDALDHRFDHGWYDVPSDFDVVGSILLNEEQPRPIAAGLSWWGHLVAYYGVVMRIGGKLWQPGDPLPTSLSSIAFEILFRNSWGASWGDNGYGTLVESKAIPDGASMPYTNVPSPSPTPPPAPPTPDPIPPDPEPAPVPTPTPEPPWWPWCKKAQRALLAAGREFLKH